MQAQEFYPAYQTSFDGIGKIIVAAYHGYDGSTPIMVQPDSAGQVENISDRTVMQLLDGTSYHHYTVSPNPAIRTTTVNLYGGRKGLLNAVEDPETARYMVVSASAVIDLDRLNDDHSSIYHTVQQVLSIKAEQNQAKEDVARQAKLDRRAELQAQLEALDAELEDEG